MLDNQYFYIGLIIVEAVIIISLFVANIRTKKRNNRYKELLSQYKKSVREEQLDAKLQNEYHIANKYISDVEVVPYSVEYHEESKVEPIDAVCAHLIYHGNIATRKYAVSIIDEAYLGSDKTNKICINEADIDSKHLRLMKQGKELYIQKVSNNYKAVLIRGKQRYNLEDVPVKINQGDVIEFKDSTMEIGII